MTGARQNFPGTVTSLAFSFKTLAPKNTIKLVYRIEFFLDFV